MSNVNIILMRFIFKNIRYELLSLYQVKFNKNKENKNSTQMFESKYPYIYNNRLIVTCRIY